MDEHSVITFPILELNPAACLHLRQQSQWRDPGLVTSLNPCSWIIRRSSCSGWLRVSRARRPGQAIASTVPALREKTSAALARKSAAAIGGFFQYAGGRRRVAGAAPLFDCEHLLGGCLVTDSLPVVPRRKEETGPEQSVRRIVGDRVWGGRANP